MILKAIVVLVVLISIAFVFITEPSPHVPFDGPSGSQNEITTASPLLDSNGHLTQTGWSRYPLLTYNKEQINFFPAFLSSLQFLKIKEWDFYVVWNEDLFFSLALADLGYIASVGVSLVDFKTSQTVSKCEGLMLFPQLNLSRDSNSEGVHANVHIENEGIHVSVHVSNGLRYIKVQTKELSAAFTLGPITRDHESIVTVTPIGDNHFYYNRKVYGTPINQGWIETTSGKKIEISDKTHNTIFDWGRGVWDYQSAWIWAGASVVLPDGRKVSLNFGGGFGNASQATENAIIVDNKVHKLGRVDIQYDKHSLMNPWIFSSADGRMKELIFAPFLERTVSENFVLIASTVHQAFGKFHGSIVTDDGEIIELRGAVGFAEAHTAKW